nr:PhF00094.1 [Neoporphyra haitanensis]
MADSTGLAALHDDASRRRAAAVALVGELIPLLDNHLQHGEVLAAAPDRHTARLTPTRARKLRRRAPSAYCAGGA